MAVAKGPGPQDMLASDMAAIVAALNDLLGPHVDHPWRQVGRCVYCATCDVRLFQGQIPKDHPRGDPPPRTGRLRSSPTSQMRDLWNMDDRPSSSSDRLCP